MSALVFGPHILTNMTTSGRPFSAKFRASVKKNGVQRDRLGGIFRDNAGRLRLDMEFQGVLVAHRILDPVAGVQTIVDHGHKTLRRVDLRTGAAAWHAGYQLREADDRRPRVLALSS